MLEQLRVKLKKLESIPPWKNRLGRRTLNTLFEGVGAPEPGEYKEWQTNIQNLKREIAEEDARQEINRP